jgi:O-antigen/teichoic acid export membrane protein
LTRVNPGVLHADLKKLARKSSFSLLGKFFGYGLQFTYKFMVARLLGADLYGLFFLGLMFINVGELISRLGLQFGVIRYVAIYNGQGDPGKLKAVIVQALKAAGSVALTLSFFYLTFGGAFIGKSASGENLSSVIRFLALGLPASAIGWILFSSLEGLQAIPSAVSVRHLLQPLVMVSVTLMCFFAGWQLDGALLGYVLGLYAGMGGALYFLHKAFPFKEISTDKKLPRGILFRYSMPLFFVSLLQFILLRVDAFFLGYFVSSRELGIYGVALNLALVSALVLEALNSIFTPMIAELYHRKEEQKLARIFKIVTHWIFIPSIMFFLAVILFADPLLGFFGEDFRGGAEILIILSFGILFHNVAGSVGAMLLMSGRQKTYLANMLGIFVLKVMGNLLLVPQYGLWGAAIVNTASIVLLNLIMLMQVYIFLGMHPYSKSYLKPCIAGTIALMSTIGIQSILPNTQDVGWILISAFFLVGSYFLALYILGFSEEEKLLFAALKQKMQ